MKIKKYIWLVFVIIILVLFQTSFFNVILGVELNPNLILAFAFSLLFINSVKEGMFAAFAGGVLLDLLGFSVIGLSAVLFILFLYIGVLITKYVFNNWFSQLAIVIFSALIYNIAINFDRAFITPSVLLGAFITALLVLIFNYVNFFINKRVFVEEKYLNIRDI
jgi:rod shape-determining protein MreD